MELPGPGYQIVIISEVMQLFVLIYLFYSFQTTGNLRKIDGVFYDFMIIYAHH